MRSLWAARREESVSYQPYYVTNTLKHQRLMHPLTANADPMSDDLPAHSPDAAAVRLALLEQRLARIETHLGIADSPLVAAAPLQQAQSAPLPSISTALAAVSEPAATSPEVVAEAADELELSLGQDWFAAAGIVALSLGVGFMLSLPYGGLPAGVPSLAGYAAVAVLFGLAQVGRRVFAHGAGYLQGAGMSLLYWATLRFMFFGTQSVLDVHGMTGGAVLAAAASCNLGFAWWRRSGWLMVLALVTACATPLVVGAGGFMAVTVVVLAAVVVAAAWRMQWRGLVPIGIGLIGATYFTWASGNLIFGGIYHWASTPWFAPGCLLVAMMILGAASLVRAADDCDDVLSNLSAVLTCSLGYGLYLLHTAAAFPEQFFMAHMLAFVVMLCGAIAFWVRRQSRVSTFFYAMTGYAALTMAIVKASPVPDVFVWLSLQSLVVVATAIWFRSRFIVVANFLICVMIVAGYMFVNEHESGISVGFGIVALVSARLLNWKRDRLELKTGLMRNAYLIGAFLVFPYALHHLMPSRGVALSWVGLALLYYGLGYAVKNQKYRWMGHATLLLTGCYLVVVGASRFEPVYRVLSFLAFGTVLLIVSLVFTRLRKRAHPVVDSIKPTK